jgi:hypothetical protein
LKDPVLNTYPDHVKSATDRVKYLENLKKQFEDAQGKIGEMIDH